MHDSAPAVPVGAVALYAELFDPYASNGGHTDVDTVLSAVAAAYGATPGDVVAATLAATVTPGAVTTEMLSFPALRSSFTDVVEVVARQGTHQHLMWVAQNPTAARIPGLLEELATTGTPLVQYGVVKNPQRPRELLSWLEVHATNADTRFAARHALRTLDAGSS